MSKREIYACDVCESEGEVKKTIIQVIFTTDQTEGRATDPYLSNQNVEICEDCYANVLKGNYLVGAGAQGFNKYYFKKYE